jgi:MscS family membrane protein
MIKDFISWSSDIGLRSWMVEVFVIVFVTLLLGLVSQVVLKRLYERLKRTRTAWDHSLVEALARPLQVLIWLVGLSFAVAAAGRNSDSALLNAVGSLREVGVIVILAWFLMRFIRRGEQIILSQASGKGKTVDYTAVDAIGKLLRLTVAITAVLVALQTLGFSIAGVLTFGGVGGIAVGFAARDLLANFFGGLMVYMDRPFSVGDWIRSPDRNIEGTVEEIGWRITRIRTFDSRPLYVPNSTFATIALENPSRMRSRRIFETVGIRYDDADRIKDIVANVKSMLTSHDGIDHNQTLIVNFNAFASSSMDFFMYCFTTTSAWVEFHEIKQDVLLRTLDIIEAHGAQCAFPTSTVHLFQEPVPPTEAGSGEGPRG